MGVITWIPLTLMGMANAGGLALLAGLMEFLPGFGPGLSGLIGTAIALFQGSTWMPVNNVTFAVIVLIIYMVIAQIETVYLIPRLVGGQVRLHPAVTFVAIISGTIVFGLLGVLLATPIVASARTLLSYIYRKLTDQEPFEELAPPQSEVRIPGVIAGRKIEGIIFDLDGTLAFVDWHFADWAERRLPWLDRIVSPENRRRIARRLMIALEGFVHFLIGLARRLRINDDLDRAFPAPQPHPRLSPCQPHAGDARGRRHPVHASHAVPDRPCLDPQPPRGAGLPLQVQPAQRGVRTRVGREDVRYLLPNSDVLMIRPKSLASTQASC